MVFNKIKSSLKRKRMRRYTTKQVLSHPQTNEGVVNVHRLDTTNVGDYYCAPHHYFEKLKDTSLDIFAYRSTKPGVAQNFIDKVNHNGLIIGGGGLLNRNGFKLQMKLFEKLAQTTSKKTVLWGVGHNSKEAKTFDNVTEYNVDVESFGLAGTRDKSMPGEFVPCVSCMHEIFDRSYTTTRETGIIFHKDTVRKYNTPEKFGQYDSIANSSDLETMISFIGTSEYLITDSYHAMYWSMLLGKKVAVVPNSSKFFDFIHKPIITDFDNCLKDVKKAESFDGLLEKCRSINLDFYNRVETYLEL